MLPNSQAWYHFISGVELHVSPLPPTKKLEEQRVFPSKIARNKFSFGPWSVRTWLEGQSLLELEEYSVWGKKAPPVENWAIGILSSLIDEVLRLGENGLWLVAVHPAQVFITPGQVKIKFDVAELLQANELHVSPSRESKSQRTLMEFGKLTSLAPEILLEQKPTKQSVVWSVGVILHRLVFGVLPVSARSVEELKQSLKTYQFYPPQIEQIQHPTNSIQSLLWRLLKVESSQRPSLSDLSKELKQLAVMQGSSHRVQITSGTFWQEQYTLDYFQHIECKKAIQNLCPIQATVHRAQTINHTLKGTSETELKRRRLCFRFVLYTAQLTIKLFAQTYNLKLDDETIANVLSWAYSYLVDVQFQAVLSSQSCMADHLFAEKQKFLLLFKNFLKKPILQDNPAMSRQPAVDCLQATIEILTERVIAESDSEPVLKIAAFHCNILLDCIELEKSVSSLFRYDTALEDQEYLKQLKQLDFETLVQLMNAKIECSNSSA